MSSHPELKLDWCSHKAAKWAVEHWHYSKTLPTPPRIYVGAWERGRFVGCVVFSRGNAPNVNKQYGVAKTEIAELTRVALTDHATPTSRVVAVALRLLRRRCPGLRLVVSYADIDQGHMGTIYQATGWAYCGWTKGGDRYRDATGREWHSRMLSPTGITKVYGKRRRVLRPQDLERIRTKGRHKYLMPLDSAMRTQIEPLRQPYPKRVRSDTIDTPADQAGEGGEAPTRALHVPRETAAV